MKRFSFGPTCHTPLPSHGSFCVSFHNLSSSLYASPLGENSQSVPSFPRINSLCFLSFLMQAATSICPRGIIITVFNVLFTQTRL